MNHEKWRSAVLLGMFFASHPSYIVPEWSWYHDRWSPGFIIEGLYEMYQWSGFIRVLSKS